MFQKEVAQRICEKKGTKAWNIISFSTGFMMQNICLL
jgi:16S rRNA A1518/A1519 N6-dimethyltransferase RsmA/KsgA/DIM1 with predicted DNA glycosylase/AP lyase activity